jgi:hypothetical protein
MKKYLLTSAAALAFCGLFTSCTHDLGYDGEAAAAQNSVVKTYEQAFITAFGQPDPNNDWGFGPSTAKAATRGGTRAVPGIEFPNNFKNETNITGPGTIQKPSITKGEGVIVISSSQTLNSISDNSTVYVESGVTVTLPNWFSMQNVKFYMSSGSQLNVQNLYLKGNTEFVNDGGTIEAGTNNLILENFTGTFWNNGTINVKEFKTSNGEGGNIYLGSDSELNATNLYLFKKVLLRNEGEITLTGEFNADQYGHKIYNSGTITTPKIILQKETVLWNEGTITAANNKEIEYSSISNDDVQIYNGESATLKLENLKLTNNRQLVVNKGTLNVKNAIAMENNSEINNSGTLTGSSMELKSGAKFYNESGNTVTISGLTKVYNNSQNNVGNVWRNAGYFNTGSFEVTGGVAYPAAFNNCHMTVTDKFFMNEGFFVLDGGAAVECGSFEWQDNNYFHMGGKALLKVEGQLLANNKNNSPQYGFWGDATDYAVIQAGSIEKGSKGKCRAAYYGNLFIDTDNHFTQGENSADGTWYTFGDNVKFSFTDNTDVTGFQTHDAKTAQKAKNFSITIPRDNNGCTPGYKYGDDEPKPSSGIVRVICEDLSVKDDTDWDFNDAVFDVQLFDNDSKVKITLRAAGGTLPLYIGNDNEAVEIHAKFKEFNPGLSISTGTMLSTGTSNSTGKYAYTGCAVPSYFINNTFGSTNVKEVAKNIPIKVQKLVNGEMRLILLECEKGKATAKVAVNKEFDWCDERQHINSKYRYEDTYGNEYGGFSLFVRGIFSADEWSNYNGPLTPEMVEQLGQ